MVTNPSISDGGSGQQTTLLRMVFLTIVIAGGCARGQTPNSQREFRESKGHVGSYLMELSDPVLRVAVLVKLKDGRIVLPKLYYFQKHKTLSGVRDVEKEGKISATIGRDNDPSYRDLYLPISDQIAMYYLLLRKPLGPKEEQPVKGVKLYNWSKWHAISFSAKDLVEKKNIQIPALEDFPNETNVVNESTLKQLVALYDRAQKEAQFKADAPVNPGDRPSWWGQ